MNIARDKYVELLGKSHYDFFVIKLSQSLFYIHHSPFFGATPDGLVNCACHGPAVLVIKCPFRCKEASFKEAATQVSFCLEEDDDSFQLKEYCAYYYQIQLQIKICRVDYADFVVWKEDRFIQMHNRTRDAMERAEPIYEAGNIVRTCGLPGKKQA